MPSYCKPQKSEAGQETRELKWNTSPQNPLQVMAGGEAVHVAYWSRPDFPLPDYFSSQCIRVRAAWGQCSLCGLDQSSSSESNYSFHFVWGLPAAGRRWSSERLCRTTWRSSLQLESYWHWVQEPGVASGAPCCGWWHWCLIWGHGAPPAP